MANNHDSKFVPYVPATSNIPEITPRAVVLGIILGVVLTAANAYLGLYVGLTVSASIPAAVISMGILRGLLRRGTILENNIVQTIAASGETLAAGIIFTVPAMLVAGVWTDIEFWPTALICFTGGMLGICFMIPLRKTHIVEDKTLTFPEGTACAEVLKAGEVGGVNAKWVLISIVFGFAIKALSKFVNLFKETLEWAWNTGGTVIFAGLEVSPALIGVGYIVGFNVAITSLLGGFIVCDIAVPLYLLNHPTEGAAGDLFWGTWKQMRFIGVGTMIVAAVWSLFKIRKGIWEGFREALLGYKSENAQEVLRTELNMKRAHIYAILGLTTLLVLGLYYYLLQSAAVAVVTTLCMIVMSFFFVAVASYICGLVGSSNSPVSGMTICAVLATGGILWLFGVTGINGVIATLGVAGVVCCAACSSGDIAQDLKTGYILGATPRSQQWMEVVGAIIPAIIMAPILIVLHHAYGIGTGQPGSLNAPQATLFANLAKGMMGEGTGLPWGVIGIGVGIGVVGVIIDEVLKANKSKYFFPVMALAVGMYLPLMLTVTLAIGGLISAATKDKNEAGVGVLFASGLVAGDAILGVIGGGVKYFNKDLIPVKLPESIAETDILTIAVTILIAVVLWMVAREKKVAAK